MTQPALLEMRHVSKSFPGVRALNDVHFEVLPGEVHALLGENGAGKSTLMKILGGIHRPDAGEILIAGVPQQIGDVNIANQAGISVIHQELALAPNLTVAENISMGAEPTAGSLGFVDYRAMRRRAQELIDHFNLPLHADDEVAGLTIAQQQLVEIARALARSPRIVVMDEPTASLSDHEVELLFAAIGELKERGVGVVYISHRMDELFAIADRVTVLRDGSYIGTRRITDTTRRELIAMMVGQELSELFATPGASMGEVVLEARGLTRGKKVRGCSFELRRGEILGFFGLVGAGRTELMRLVFGVDRPEAGEVRFKGRPLRPRYAGDAVASKIVMVPEDRKGQGAFLSHEVGFNITIASLGAIIRGLRVDHAAERRLVDELIMRLGIKVASPEQALGNLSGGNQQKVVLAKWLATAPEVLILDEPTRGIDVGAKKEIYELMRRLTAGGVSIILVSSELPEVTHMANRVVTMCQGRVTGVLEGAAITRENILTHAMKEA